MSRERSDELAQQLFAAARCDAPPEASLRRVSVAFERRRERTHRFRTLATVAVGSFAIAAGAVLVSLGGRDRVSIGMEPAKRRNHPPAPPPPAPAMTSTAERTAPARPRRPIAPVRVAPPTLADELASLNRARTSLRAGEPERTLSELDRYDRTLRGTALRSEATLLRIEALLRAGRRDQAAAIVAQFIERHPNDPLVDRARALMTQSSEEPADAGR